MVSQMKFPGTDEAFLQDRLKESRLVIGMVANLSKRPLIIQFSGGKDSMALLGLVREVTNNYVCAYMATGLEFKGVIQFVKDSCDKYGARLLVSHPGLHKGNLFKRIEQFRSWPGLIATWCCRDLKLRPEKKLLAETFGKGPFYKLEGIRRFESTRRKFMYKQYAESPIREDGEHKGSYEVFPILNWSDADVLNYLEMTGLPTSGLYNEFGVSGCSWCPFYQSTLYYRILQKMPDYPLYRRVIEWEDKLGQPSVSGHIFMRDIRQAVRDGQPCPQSQDGKGTKSPCMTLFEGRMVPTCTVYGHFFTDGECYRCGAKEVLDGRQNME